MTEVTYRCPECGNTESLYARSDLRWNAETREWDACLDAMEYEIDCTECDHMGPIATFEEIVA
jgi:hypothetical protein